MALFLVGSPVGTLSKEMWFRNLSGGVWVSVAIVMDVKMPQNVGRTMVNRGERYGQATTELEEECRESLGMTPMKAQKACGNLRACCVQGGCDEGWMA